jgi:neurofibromin 1
LDTPVDTEVLNEIHRLFANNLDRLADEFAGISGSIQSFTAEEPPTKLIIPGPPPISQRGAESLTSRKAFEALSALIGQLGPVAGPESPVGLKSETSDAGETQQAYIDFMARFESADLTSIKARKLFYDAGSSKARNPVFYFIARRFNTNEVDLELVVYYILTMIKPLTNKSFDVVMDISRFTEQNEFGDPQWLAHIIEALPIELLQNLANLYLFNVNTSFKKYIKKLARLIPTKLVKKIISVNSLNEFNDFISPIELRLPRSTGICLILSVW